MRDMTNAVLPKKVTSYLSQSPLGGYDADIAKVAKKHFATESSANRQALTRSAYFSAGIGVAFIGLTMYSYRKQCHKSITTTLGVVSMAAFVFGWYLHGRTHAFACAMCQHAQNGEDQKALECLFKGVSNEMEVDDQPLLNYAARGKCRITAGTLMLLLDDQTRADMGGKALAYCHDDAKFCDLLIELGASLNNEGGYYLLIDACKNKDAQRIKWLIESGAPTQGYPTAPIEYLLEGDSKTDTTLLEAFNLSIDAIRSCGNAPAIMDLLQAKQIAISLMCAEKLFSELS